MDPQLLSARCRRAGDDIAAAARVAKTRDDVVPLYAVAIALHRVAAPLALPPVDFMRANMAILDRWSVAALNYIKKAAWDRNYALDRGLTVAQALEELERPLNKRPAAPTTGPV